MKNLVRFIFSSNGYSANLESRKTVIYVLAVSFVGTLILAMVNITPCQMIILGLAFLVALWLAVRGRIFLARWGALFAGLGLISSLMVLNYGIRDTAVVGLVVILISAGLLAGRHGTLVIGGCIILIILAIGILETRGIINNKFSQYNFFADYFVVAISIALISTLQWLVINQLNENIVKANSELSERKLIEEKLRDAENRYRNLVERIPAVVYVAEPGQHGKWQYISPQITALIGFTPEDWMSDQQFWYNNMHPDDRNTNMERENLALKSDNMPRLEYRLKTKNGNYIWIYDEGLFFVDAANQILVQGFMLDITARKIAEEELKKRITDLDAVRGVSEALIVKTDLKNLIQHTGEQIKSYIQCFQYFHRPVGYDHQHDLFSILL